MEQEFVRVAKEMIKDLEIFKRQEFSQRLLENGTQIDSLKELYKDQKSMSVYIAEAVGSWDCERISRFTRYFRIVPDKFVVRFL